MTHPAHSPDIDDRQSALEFLFGRIDYERTRHMPYRSRRFKLDRMRDLLALLEHPERNLPVVHIAGTKGKGSTAKMVAAALTAAGYRCGLYTSPHLEHLEERFAVDGQICSPAELVQLLAQIQTVVRRMDRQVAAGHGDLGPTYFEITTAAALLHFQRRQVDCAVLEVGLGGRLDSTNVCHPVVSVITSISFDHMKQLGDTQAKIAGEKAGIIKPGVPVVTGVEHPEPFGVIQRKASWSHSHLLALGKDFHFNYHAPLEASSGATHPPLTRLAASRMDYSEHVDGKRVELSGVDLGMLGCHQAANAAVALATLGQMRRDGWVISQQAMRRGLAEARCPARIEIAQLRPTIVLDAAHNEASVAALLRVLDERFPRDLRILVFAASVDKDAGAMLRQLLPRFDHVILTRYLNNPRPCDPETLSSISERIRQSGQLIGPRLSLAADPLAAWQQVRSMVTPDHLVCVAGSFFIAAEMRRHIEAARSAGLALENA